MVSANVLWLQLLFSTVVITVFGYRQFNTWTAGEASRDTTDSELLAFAPPRSFTALWRFLAIASLYCLALVVLYLVLFVLLQGGPEMGGEFLALAGVTPQNAWMVALLIVTGLSPMLPVFSNIEHALREVMHNWAVVPAKAQQMADELACPMTHFDIDEAFLRTVVLPTLPKAFGRADVVDGSATTIAQKWCRLNFLICKFAPPSQQGLAARRFNSPYVSRFVKDFGVLDREVREFVAHSPELLRTIEGLPETVTLPARIDDLQHRLFVLISCRAFASARSVEEVARYFRSNYGIRVARVQFGSPTFDPIVDALLAVTFTVLLISLGFSIAHPDQTGVRPVVWAVSAFCTHGAGVLVGWMVFSRRRRLSQPWSDAPAEPVSRKLMIVCIVLAFALATLPTFAVTLYAEYLRVQDVFTSWAEVGTTAFQRSWPWAWLGSATAAATFIHLERTANGPVTFGFRAVSALAHATVNVGIALVILSVHTRTGSGAPDLLVNLQRPVLQLVLGLTASIGLVLGFFLPSAVRGHGLDRRAGVERHGVDGERALGVFTFGGKQLPIVLKEMSLSGAVFELQKAPLDIAPGRHGMLTLCDETTLRVYVVRLLPDGDGPAEGTTMRIAVRHLRSHGAAALTSTMGRKLSQFLRRDVSPAAA